MQFYIRHLAASHFNNSTTRFHANLYKSANAILTMNKRSLYRNQRPISAHGKNCMDNSLTEKEEPKRRNTNTRTLLRCVNKHDHVRHKVKLLSMWGQNHGVYYKRLQRLITTQYGAYDNGIMVRNTINYQGISVMSRSIIGYKFPDTKRRLSTS